MGKGPGAKGGPEVPPLNVDTPWALPMGYPKSALGGPTAAREQCGTAVGHRKSALGSQEQPTSIRRVLTNTDERLQERTKSSQE